MGELRNPSQHKGKDGEPPACQKESKTAWVLLEQTHEVQVFDYGIVRGRNLLLSWPYSISSDKSYGSRSGPYFANIFSSAVGDTGRMSVQPRWWDSGFKSPQAGHSYKSVTRSLYACLRCWYSRSLRAYSCLALASAFLSRLSSHAVMSNGEEAKVIASFGLLHPPPLYSIRPCWADEVVFIGDDNLHLSLSLLVVDMRSA